MEAKDTKQDTILLSEKHKYFLFFLNWHLVDKMKGINGLQKIVLAGSLLGFTGCENMSEYEPSSQNRLNSAIFSGAAQNAPTQGSRVAWGLLGQAYAAEAAHQERMAEAAAGRSQININQNQYPTQNSSANNGTQFTATIYPRMNLWTDRNNNGQVEAEELTETNNFHVMQWAMPSFYNESKFPINAEIIVTDSSKKTIIDDCCVLAPCPDSARATIKFVYFTDDGTNNMSPYSVAFNVIMDARTVPVKKSTLIVYSVNFLPK